MPGDTILPQLEQSLPSDRKGMQMSEALLVDSDLEFKSWGGKKMACFGLHPALGKKKGKFIEGFCALAANKELT